MGDERFAVSASPHVTALLEKLHAAAEKKPAGKDADLLKMLRRLMTEVLCHKRFVMEAKYRLRHDLSGVCRSKQGRFRFYFLVSEEHKRTIMLYVGMQRKQGAKDDAYEEFKRLLRRGDFDEQFEELGMERPEL